MTNHNYTPNISKQNANKQLSGSDRNNQVDLGSEQPVLMELATTVLQRAALAGATSAEVGLSLGSGLNTTVRLGKVDTIEFNRDKSLSLTVYNGYQKGNVSVSDFGSQAIDNAINSALNIAKYTASDNCNGLAEKALCEPRVARDLGLYHPQAITAEMAIEQAKLCEAAALSNPKITNSDGATFASSAKLRVYANSNGVLDATLHSSYSMSCVVIAKDQTTDTMHRDYDYTVARNYQKLHNFAAVGSSAAANTIAKIGARKIKTCKVPVIFSAKLAPGLIGSFVNAISGSNLYRNTSFLVGSLGQQVFPNFITLHEDPFMYEGLGSALSDAEGVVTKAKNLVAAGVVESYVLGSYSARKLGMSSTANAGGVHNLLLQVADGANAASTSTQDFAALLKTMGRGLVITELMGHGINLATGDYSRGAVGFWVENGIMQYPVHEITVAGNLKTMLAGIVAIGSDTEMRSNIRTGSLLIAEMTVAGV
jgi:PmbA protein